MGCFSKLLERPFLPLKMLKVHQNQSINDSSIAFVAQCHTDSTSKDVVELELL